MKPLLHLFSRPSPQHLRIDQLKMDDRLFKNKILGISCAPHINSETHVYIKKSVQKQLSSVHVLFRERLKLAHRYCRQGNWYKASQFLCAKNIEIEEIKNKAHYYYESGADSLAEYFAFSGAIRGDNECEYLLGSILIDRGEIDAGRHWYDRAATQGNVHAEMELDDFALDEMEWSDG